jgi:hypothetical protein
LAGILKLINHDELVRACPSALLNAISRQTEHVLEVDIPFSFKSVFPCRPQLFEQTEEYVMPEAEVAGEPGV